jgi:hypothetical protein
MTQEWLRHGLTALGGCVMTTSSEQQKIAEVNKLLKDLKKAKNGKDLARAAEAILRHGKSLSSRDLDLIVDCGCGPSGERGIEDGICGAS